MRKGVWRWMSSRRSIISGLSNLMETRLSNIRGRLESRWESCQSRERKREKKIKKERFRMKKKSGKRLNTRSNNLGKISLPRFRKRSNNKLTGNIWTSNQKISSMIGSFATIVARHSMSLRSITSARTVWITCCARTVLTWLFTSILCIRVLCRWDLGRHSRVSVLKYCRNCCHARCVDERFPIAWNTTRMKTGLRTCRWCVRDAMMIVVWMWRRSFRRFRRR